MKDFTSLLDRYEITYDQFMNILVYSYTSFVVIKEESDTGRLGFSGDPSYFLEKFRGYVTEPKNAKNDDSWKYGIHPNVLKHIKESYLPRWFGKNFERELKIYLLDKERHSSVFEMDPEVFTNILEDILKNSDK
jgi:hypothetical protein